VLAVYPDPKTAQPLIGAGFSLDLPAREHPQHDAMNPRQFLEPSSKELWFAAGLDPARRDGILDVYRQQMAAWKKRKYRNKIKSLEAQITEDEATQLMRIGIVQAIYNARAYCRKFDELSASQQMAMTQLVYQMGVNLEEFTKFLDLINDRGNAGEAAIVPVGQAAGAGGDAAYWKSVQQTLMQSQWARLYRTRAVAVIAMLDPRYTENPTMAERRVGAVLRPAVAHRRKGRAKTSRQLASSGAAPAKPAHRRPARSKTKRTA